MEDLTACNHSSDWIGYIPKSDCRFICMCAVLFTFDEDPSAGQFKFLTGSLSLKDTLNRAREAEKGGKKIFPVDNVVVKRKNLGNGKISYYFE